MDGKQYVVRKVKNNNFTIISNELIEDERLSWRARGVLIYMLSKPNDWVFYDTELAKHSESESVTAIRTAMKELKACGYVKKEAIKGEDGRIKKWITIVSESPDVQKPQCGETSVWNHHNVVESQLLSTDSFTKDLKNTNNSESDKSDIDKVIEKYKELENLPGFNKITTVRKKAINARIQEEGLQKVIAVLEELNKDEYYINAKREGLRWYKFDYVFNPTKFNMLVERFENNSYNNNNTQQNQTAIYQKEVKVEDLYNGGEWE